MTAQELGSILKKMYDYAPSGEKKVMIVLFGIQYANEIIDNNISRSEIIKALHDGTSETYLPELGIGINLAKYVKPNN